MNRHATPSRTTPSPLASWRPKVDRGLVGGLAVSVLVHFAAGVVIARAPAPAAPAGLDARLVDLVVRAAPPAVTAAPAAKPPPRPAPPPEATPDPPPVTPPPEPQIAPPPSEPPPADDPADNVPAAADSSADDAPPDAAAPPPQRAAEAIGNDPDGVPTPPPGQPTRGATADGAGETPAATPPAEAPEGSGDGPPTAATAPTTDPDALSRRDRASIARWETAVLERLAVLSASTRLRRLGVSGRVEIAIVVDDRGRILEATVHRSSGDPDLDAAVLEEIEALRRLPSPPRVLGATTRRIVPVIVE